MSELFERNELNKRVICFQSYNVNWKVLAGLCGAALCQAVQTTHRTGTCTQAATATWDGAFHLRQEDCETRMLAVCRVAWSSRSAWAFRWQGSKLSHFLLYIERWLYFLCSKVTNHVFTEMFVIRHKSKGADVLSAGEECSRHLTFVQDWGAPPWGRSPRQVLMGDSSPAGSLTVLTGHPCNTPATAFPFPTEHAMLLLYSDPFACGKMQANQYNLHNLLTSFSCLPIAYELIGVTETPVAE